MDKTTDFPTFISHTDWTADRALYHLLISSMSLTQFMQQCHTGPYRSKRYFKNVVGTTGICAFCKG